MTAMGLGLREVPKEIDTTTPTMRGNGTNKEKFNFVEMDTSFEQDANRAQENKGTSEIMDVVANMIWLSKQEKEETDYTVKKGNKISKKLVEVNLRQEWHRIAQTYNEEE
jgi:hypothetical protein